jgi:hypothetical protein
MRPTFLSESCRGHVPSEESEQWRLQWSVGQGSLFPSRFAIGTLLLRMPWPLQTGVGKQDFFRLNSSPFWRTMVANSFVIHLPYLITQYGAGSVSEPTASLHVRQGSFSLAADNALYGHEDVNCPCNCPCIHQFNSACSRRQKKSFPRRKNYYNNAWAVENSRSMQRESLQFERIEQQLQAKPRQKASNEHVVAHEEVHQVQPRLAGSAPGPQLMIPCDELPVSKYFRRMGTSSLERDTVSDKPLSLGMFYQQRMKVLAQ